ncbi:ATP-binding cassette domain-containing protein [Dubosiella newyorkensis]|uniref:ATP-binding cassette domain-containing protein n=1 Tax=Dubosiella newyorkensis TaxID=1862672 RepID=UPI00248C414B|nr:ABC transporter ATP-binding protein [Dubosiella newyorkensis]
MNKSWQTIRLLIKESPKYWRLSILGAILASLPWFVSTWIVSWFLARAIDQVNDMAWDPVGAFIFVLFVIIMLRVPVVYGYRLNSWAAEKLSARFQWKLLRSWNRRDPADVSISFNETLTRILNDCAQSLSEFFFQGFGLKILEPVLTGVIALVVLWMLQWKIALLSIGLGVVLSIFTIKFTKTIEDLHATLQTKNDQLNQIFNDNLSNMETIKAMDLRSLKLDQFDHCSCEIQATANQLAKIEILLKTLPKFGELILIVFTLRFSVLDPAFPVGNVVLVVSMQIFVNNLFSHFGTMRNELAKTAIHAHRILDTLDELHSFERKENKAISFPYPVTSFQMDHIDFSYGNQSILRDVCLVAKKRELTILKAPSGSGKSTLLDIIQGWRQAEHGTILWNGQKHIHCGLFETRKKIRLFGQAPVLFQGTIRENIELAASRPLNEEELKKIAVSVNWKNCEMETMIEEGGSNLSGGQRQKITLMQALVSDVDVLLLDEPTSALDQKSEEVVYETLNRLKQEKILLIATHRPLLIRKADSIYSWQNKKWVQLNS